MCIGYFAELLIQISEIFIEIRIIVVYSDRYLEGVYIRADWVPLIGLQDRCEEGFQKRDELILQTPHNIFNELHSPLNFRVLILDGVLGFFQVGEDERPNQASKFHDACNEMVFGLIVI